MRLVFHPKWALLFWRATLWHGQKQLYLCCPHWHWQQFIHVSTSDLTPHASPSSLQAMSCSSLELLQHQQLHLFHLCLFSRHGGTKPVKHHRHCLSLSPPPPKTPVCQASSLWFSPHHDNKWTLCDLLLQCVQEVWCRQRRWLLHNLADRYLSGGSAPTATPWPLRPQGMLVTSVHSLVSGLYISTEVRKSLPS